MLQNNHSNNRREDFVSYKSFKGTKKAQGIVRISLNSNFFILYFKVSDTPQCKNRELNKIIAREEQNK